MTLRMGKQEPAEPRPIGDRIVTFPFRCESWPQRAETFALTNSFAGELLARTGVGSRFLLDPVVRSIIASLNAKVPRSESGRLLAAGELPTRLAAVRLSQS